jgi:hypothetical protein
VVSAEKPTSTADAIFRMASMDLSPMAEAARASAQGSFERKITAWRSLFQGLVPVAKWESPIA